MEILERIPQVYYARSIALYDTPQGVRDIAMLSSLGFHVLDPDNPQSEAGYEREGMTYFRTMIEQADVLAFRANPDGSINAGVAQEIEWAEQLGRPVIELPCGIKRRTLTVDQTRAHLREQGAR